MLCCWGFQIEIQLSACSIGFCVGAKRYANRRRCILNKGTLLCKIIYRYIKRMLALFPRSSPIRGERMKLFGNELETQFCQHSPQRDQNDTFRKQTERPACQDSSSKKKLEWHRRLAMARQLALWLEDRGHIVDRAYMERNKVCLLVEISRQYYDPLWARSE